MKVKTLFSNAAKDIPASIVVFLVALPLCLGVAVASDAQAMNGLIAGIIGGIVVGALSGSHLSVSGPAAGLATIVAASLEELGTFEAFAVAVFIAGLLQIVLGIIKAGVIGRYIPNSVIKGMLAAIGILLILKQIPHAVGYDASPEGHEAFFQPGGENTFSELLIALNRFSPLAFLIAAVSAGVLLVYELKKVKSAKITQLLPGPLLAVAAGILINEFLLPKAHLLALHDEHLVQLPFFSGPADFFSGLQTPDWFAIGNYQVWITAVTITIVASLETLLSLEAVDKIDPEKRISPPNRELIAQGSGNVLSGLLGGLPITSVIVRSAANVNSGAKSKLSTILHGSLLLVSLLLIPGVLNMIPKAALASILIFTGYKLAKISLFKEYYKKGIDQFLPFVVTVVAIVFTDLLIGIVIGILTGLFFTVKSNFRSAMVVVNDGNKYLVRFSREVSFLNKSKLMGHLSKIPDGASVLIDPLKNEFMDLDIIETVNDFIASSKARNIKVYIKREKSQKELFEDPYKLVIE
jgi:MFS superfamily sulfate permease-like transporter